MQVISGHPISRRDVLIGGAALGAVATTSLASVAPVHAQETLSDAGKAADSESGACKTSDILYQVSDYNNIKSKSEAGESGHYDFKYLNQPLQIGPFTLKNRIVKSASSGFECSGTPEAEVEHYRRIAQGGVGMIVYAVKDLQKSDEEASQYAQVASAMHQEGIPFFAQILSESEDRSSTYDLHAPLGRPIAGKEMADAFGMTLKEMNDFVRPGEFTMLSTEELQAKIEAFAQSALHLKNVGFDGVELNAAAEHFFDSFLSRFWNRERTDQYDGSSLENRARVVTEVITRIHELCGDDFPVGVLFNGCEINGLYPGDDELCTKVDEACEFAKIFEAAGASHLQIRSVVFGNHCVGFFPDLLFANNKPDTSYGRYYDFKRWWPEFDPTYGGTGAFIETAAKIKSCVNIPVMTVGRMDPRLIPDVIDEAIGGGKIDAIDVTRSIIADYDFANKVLSGDLDSIRPCANCTHCLQGSCRVNPTYGRAYHEDVMPEGFDPEPTATAKKVLIAGGGPAGLEAAHIAAERGHQVVLCEKSSDWGGLTKAAIAAKGAHEKIQDHIDWLVAECERKGVDMRLDTEITADAIAEMGPDVFIQATGGVRHVPAIEGIDSAKVSEGYGAEGSDVVVLGGMECEGTEIASLLADSGKRVTLIDELSSDDFGVLMPTWHGSSHKYYCQTHGVNIVGGVKIERIDDEGVTVTCPHSGLERMYACDSVILSYPVDPDTALLDSVKDSVAECYAIGDCAERGLIRDAVRQGNLVARAI